MSSSARKIAIRVIVSPILIAAVLGVVYLDYKQGRVVCVPVLVGFAASFAWLEIAALAKRRGLRLASWVGAVAVFICVTRTPLWNFEPLSRIEHLFVLYILVKLVFCRMTFTVEDAALSLLAFFYVGLFRFLWEVPFDPTKEEFSLFLLFFMAVSKVPDSAAYLVGKTIGRHKFAPVISPNKTWEGAIAGLIAGTAVGSVILMKTALVPGPVEALIGASAAITISSILGDLVKSAVKRWAGAKDSGQLLPEFGGVLDIIDSFLLAAPVTSLVFQILHK